jgi:hypothetical protein
MKLTKRRAAKARAKVYADRCSARPGIYMHDWKFSHWEGAWDYTRGVEDHRVYVCTFCQKEDR